MLRILGRTSSINVRKVLWTALEADLEFVLEEAWAGEALQSPEFLQLNPNGLVPVLVSGRGALWESNTICRFLAGLAGRRDLLPEAPFARAKIERWMDWQATELNTAWRTAFMALARQDPAYTGDPVQIGRSAAAWNSLMLRLEARLQETGAYVAGETFTLADIPIGLSLQRWLLTPMERPSTPGLLAYRERLLARPSYRAPLDADTP